MARARAGVTNPRLQGSPRQKAHSPFEGTVGLHRLGCQEGVSPALPVARQHDGQHAHGGSGIFRGLSPVAEIRICLIEVSMQEVALSG